MGFGRTYPIWNRVQACIYKASKNWGAQTRCEVDVCVGTSARNSHPFVTHKTTRRDLGDGRVEFRFYVDNVLIKQAILTGEELKLHSRFDGTVFPSEEEFYKKVKEEAGGR